MKRLFSHPSLPVILGFAAVVVAGLLLGASVLYPNLFSASAAGEKVHDLVAETVSAVIPDDEAEAATPVSGSYVLEVRDQYLKEQRSFVEADLTSMTLKVYRDGAQVLDVPIKGKGKEGSWWETPVGVYSVKNKEENHFSSFGHVYQPWSLVFQGNFFIHGWPYYPDGTPVSTSYSGGCIRLSDEYAKQVYDSVEIGTPVLVYKAQKEAAPLPAFSGSPDVDGSFVVLDVPSGTTVRSRDGGGDVAFGDAVNLLTALTAVDYINVESGVSVSEPDSARLSGMGRVSVLDLLRLLLSENDPAAAHAIASTRGPAAFVKYMNAKASAIGMAHTVVASVDPADPANRTTAGDLALLARYLDENRSFVLGLTKSARGNLAYDPPAWDDLRFAPDLLGLPGFFGGVHDGDGAPAVAVLTLVIGGEKRDVAVVARDADAVSEVAAWLTR